MYKLTDLPITVDGKRHVVYGIYYNEEYHIDDISTDREAVSRMVEKFNKFLLDPIQLGDVVEDFLNE